MLNAIWKYGIAAGQEIISGNFIQCLSIIYFMMLLYCNTYTQAGSISQLLINIIQISKEFSQPSMDNIERNNGNASLRPKMPKPHQQSNQIQNAKMLGEKQRIMKNSYSGTIKQSRQNSPDNYNNKHAHNSKQRQKQRETQRQYGYSSAPYVNPHSDLTVEQQLKAQNTKLKRLLRQTQAKRIQITKLHSQLSNKYQKLEEENLQLHKKIKHVNEMGDTEKFRYQELKFLNKQLSNEIEQLRKENQAINNKLRYHTEVLQGKYQQIENKTYKRIQQALKRIKKAMHYLNTLSSKQIQKTKQIQIQNLVKSIEILQGKYSESAPYENQIEQLMNPIRNIQQQLHQTTKQLQKSKQNCQHLEQQLRKCKKIEKDLLPQYKETIEKLKKNMVQLRAQLSQIEYEKYQVKYKYEQRVQELQAKIQTLIQQNRKIKLQNKIYERKLEDMEEDVEEEKERLIDENQMLKKLYGESQQVNENIGTGRQRDLQGGRQTGMFQLMGQLDGDQSQIFKDNKLQALSYKTTANNANNHKYKQYEYKNTQAQRPSKQLLLKHHKQKQKQGANPILKKNFSASQLQVSREKQPNQVFLRQKQKYRNQKLSLRNKNQTDVYKNETKSKRSYEHLRHGHGNQLTNNADQYINTTNTLVISNQRQDNTDQLYQQDRLNDRNSRTNQRSRNNNRDPNRNKIALYQQLRYNQNDIMDGNSYEYQQQDPEAADQLAGAKLREYKRSKQKQKQKQRSKSKHRNQVNQSSLISMSQSQEGLKNQIYKIDQEIMEIQKNLDRQLNLYQ